MYFTIFTHFHLGSLGPLVNGDNPKWKIVEALLPQVYDAERRERVADEKLPKTEQKDTLIALIAWCWDQSYDLTGVPMKAAEELTIPDPVLCLVMSANGPLAARPKTRPNWPEQASGAASGQGSGTWKQPPPLWAQGRLLVP